MLATAGFPPYVYICGRHEYEWQQSQQLMGKQAISGTSSETDKVRQQDK